MIFRIPRSGLFSFRSVRSYATIKKTFDGQIPMEKLKISYSPFDGPSPSQSVAKAEVKFRVAECDWIPSPVREKFFENYKHRIDKDGNFVIRSERTRVGTLNLADCLDKLRFSIRECAESDSTVNFDQENERRRKEIDSKMRLQVKKASIG